MEIIKENVTNSEINRAIPFFKSKTGMAKELQVSLDLVSKWSCGKRKIPIIHAMKLESLTKGKIKAKDLRPDIAFEDKIIPLFKSKTALAKELNVNRSLVSKWFCGKRKIPILHAMRLEFLTKGEIRARELRPDIPFDYIEERKC